MLSFLWYTINGKYNYLEIETRIDTTRQNMFILGEMVLLDFHNAKTWCVLNKISANLKDHSLFFLSGSCLLSSQHRSWLRKKIISFFFYFFIISQNVSSGGKAWSYGIIQTTLLPAVYTLHEMGTQLCHGSILQLTNPRNAYSEWFSEKASNKRYVFLAQGHWEQKGPAFPFEGTIWPYALPL